MVRNVGFTSRDEEILELIASECTDKEVAIRLGISRKTVDGHLRRVFMRRQVRSRAAAIFDWSEWKRNQALETLSA